MPEQFLFRCRSCGRIAKESEWAIVRKDSPLDFWNIKRYPVPVCPGCESRDIDLNYGVSVEVKDGMRIHEFRPGTGTRKN